MVDKVLDKIKEIASTEKFDDTNILSNTDDKLSNDTTLKLFAILMTCAIKDANKIYPELFLYHTLLNMNKKTQSI